VTTIADVRQNLSDIADTLDGWHGSKYVGDSFTKFVIKVFRPEFDPRVVFGAGKQQLTFRCVAYAPRIDAGSSEVSLDALAEMSGAGSFIVAVQSSANWSVTVDYAQVVNVGEVGVVAPGNDGVEYLICQFDVEVVF